MLKCQFNQLVTAQKTVDISMAQAGARVGAGREGASPLPLIVNVLAMVVALVPPPSPAQPRFDVAPALLGPVSTKSNSSCEIHPQIDNQ